MKKILLTLLLLISLMITTENVNSESINSISVPRYKDSLVSFFESKCLNSSIDGYFTDSTLVDVRGNYFEADVVEFKTTMYGIIDKYNPSGCWIYRYDPKYPSYYNVIGVCDKVVIIFTFEMYKGKIDIIHIYKKNL